jgi:peptidoglycan/LPS O-acetylase OafA/YrhL
LSNIEVAAPSAGITARKTSSPLRLPTPERFYRPELDALRFLAFLLVLMIHTWMIPEGPGHNLHLLRSLSRMGGCGVPLFFVLSAFLITELLLREKNSRGNINVQKFYLRRALRIWPLYFLMLFLTFAWAHTVKSSGLSIAELSAYLFLAGNWYSAVHGPMNGFGFPLWSVCVEEQFYIAWPSLVRFATRRVIAIASILLWLLSQGCTLYLSIHGAWIHSIWTNSFVQMQYFALGALLSVALSARIPRMPALGRVGLVFGGLGCFLVAEYFCGSVDVTSYGTWLTMPGYSLIGIGAVLIFFGFLGCPMPRASKPVVYLGKISYGLYVYHGMCLPVAFGVTGRILHRWDHLNPVMLYSITLPLTILCAVVSYRFFETPFLRLKDRFAVVQTRPI